jgi:hypothetical protein
MARTVMTYILYATKLHDSAFVPISKRFARLWNYTRREGNDRRKDILSERKKRSKAGKCTYSQMCIQLQDGDPWESSPYG